MMKMGVFGRVVRRRLTGCQALDFLFLEESLSRKGGWFKCRKHRGGTHCLVFEKGFPKRD